MIPHDGEVGMMMMRGMATGPRRFIRTDHDCPDCGEKLCYSEQGVVHLDPPRRRVKCLKCMYRGFVPHDMGEVKSIDITDQATVKTCQTPEFHGTIQDCAEGKTDCSKETTV